MNITIHDIISEIERFAPLSYQESYDNAGLVTGDRNAVISSVLLCFDVTEEIIDEAIMKKAGLVISHHPVIFGGLKKITGNSATERIVIKAIQNNIALYAAHTNLDNAQGGINTTLAQKLGLKDIKILVPKENMLYKVVTFVPESHAEKVREAMFAADAGHIGNYDSCSYNISGTGTFRAGEDTNPYVGEKGQLHYEPEVRIETIVREENLHTVIFSLKQNHPYEEPAYDIYPLENKYYNAGTGAIGQLEKAISATNFFETIKKTLPVKVIRHNKLFKDIKTVAVCGGSGSPFINDAIRAKADIFVTGDCKYHQFLDYQDKIIIADIGHYESECFAIEIFYNVIIKKFPNFVVYFSHNGNNPVYYF